MSKISKKLINRNAFNEKLIHRYFFERIYLGKDKKSFVPESLKQSISKLNLVVPEHTEIYENYRADFTLFFKDSDKPCPVEIKWKSSEFNKENQVRELKKHNGFLVSFDEPTSKDLPYVKINYNDFRDWLIERIETLFEESISTKVQTTSGSKTWVVTLRGKKTHENFFKMKKECGNNLNFWAFKHDQKAMKNILYLERGDEMIFLFIKTSGNERSAMIPNSNEDINLNEAYFTKIVEPYYMVLDGPQCTFFEKPAPVNKRKFPHFFDFNRIENFEFKSPVSLSRKKMSSELKKQIAESNNHGGVLAPISKPDAENLKGQIRSQRNLL